MSSSSNKLKRASLDALVRAVWADVLGLESVGDHDDFFALGGHSLSAIQVVARLREALGYELALRILFESPTVAELVERLETEQGRSLPSLRPRRRREGPLSYAQQRLWFLDQLVPENPFYNIAKAYRLRGPLRPEALRAGLDALIARHEALRTSFSSRDGRPFQRIAAGGPVEFTVEDLDQQPVEEQAMQLRAAILAEARRPFRLDQAPLLRARLLRLGLHDHAFLLTTHHIVADDWSMTILANELSELYLAHVENRTATLPSLAVQYIDFAAWQREWLDGGPLDEQLRFWRDELHDAPALELPTDRPRPAVERHRGGLVRFEVEGAVTSQLQQLAHGSKATLFMATLAAFQALLFRYTNQADFCVGTPIANRRHTETERLVGLFVNMVILRGRLGGAPSFRETLSRTRDLTLAAYQHQDIPFDRVVDALNPERNISRHPLFQVAFQLLDHQPQPLKLDGVDVEPLGVDRGTSLFDLSWDLLRDGAGLSGLVEYNSDLFDCSTVERMITHYKRLLKAAVTDPDASICTLPLLDASERREILVTWNTPAVSANGDRLVHSVFEQQVDRRPDAPAISFGGVRWTYKELDQRANRIAHRLLGEGVAPEAIVGIHLHYGPDVVAAVLGILKAGAAYLPLDTSLPSGRLSQIIVDANPDVVLASAAGGNTLSRVSSTRIVTDWMQIRGHGSSERPHVSLPPTAAAYVLYTSGSTGAPKGVVVTHENAVSIFESWQQAYRLNQIRRHAQLASFSFDVFGGDLMRALLSGAELVLCSRDTLMDPAALLDLIQRERIECAEFVPVVARELLAHARSVGGTFESMKLFIVGSDEWSVGDHRTALALTAPATRVVNSYGLTECAVDSSFFEGPLDSLPATAAVPIGRPMANTCLYVLGADRHPTPVGIPGDLYVGGLGVGRGYIGRGALTAERFLPDPFSSRSGARMYATGDRARFRPDGNVEFLGRDDRQVKLNGQRLELPEIEAALLTHACVRSAAVVLHREERRSGLVGYVTATSPDRAPGGDELRQHLKNVLPEYMIPRTFVSLEELPTSSSGKVDRLKLPPPPSLNDADGQQRRLPRNAIEHELSRIWAELLGVENVGIDDNFFEVGGDSILSIQIIARARASGIGLTPRQIFQHQTIAEIATVAETAPTRPPYREHLGPAPLTPIQRWFFEQNFQERNHWNQALIFRPTEPLERGALEAAIAAVHNHHDALRLRFHCRNGVWHQELRPLQAEDICAVRLIECPVGQLASVIQEEATAVNASLDITRGPLIRALLLRMSEGEQRLLVVIHHLVVDGVSWRILIEDLTLAYRQLARAENVRLPERTSSYSEWARLLAARAEDCALDNEIDLWVRALTPMSRLPRDLDAGENRESSAGCVDRALTRSETSALRNLRRSRGVSVDEALIAALSLVVTRWANEPSCQIMIERHGREPIADSVDVSRTIGWFTSEFPARIELAPGAGVHDAINAVKEVFSVTPANGISYGLLRYGRSRDPATARLCSLPEPELSFNYLGEFDSSLTASQLLSVAAETPGSTVAPSALRSQLLALDSEIIAGQLRIHWTYSRAIHWPETVERLASEYVQILRLMTSDRGDAAPSPRGPPGPGALGIDEKHLEAIFEELSS